MSFTFDIKSIARSISLVGGKLGSFARKTSRYFSKNFPTISFKPSSFMGSLIGSCPLMVNNFSSFGTHFLDCLTENKRVLNKVHIFISSKAKPLGFVW
jgi:hypothetical protein